MNKRNYFHTKRVDMNDVDFGKDTKTKNERFKREWKLEFQNKV